MTYGQGRVVMYFVRYWGGGGVRCVPLVFLFIKSHNFWGAQTPLYPISLYGIHPQLSITCRGQLCNVRLSESLGDIGNIICPILVKQ